MQPDVRNARFSVHMYVRFWGVRGSLPASDPGYGHYGDNTSCVEVRCGETVLVSDAGSGLRELGAALVEEGCTEADLFLSHMHVDHVLGLPFFPFAFQGGNTLRLWSVHQPAVGTTEGAIRHLMSPPLFPVPPEIFTTDIAFLDFRAGETLNPEPGIAIRTAPLRHPGGRPAIGSNTRGRASATSRTPSTSRAGGMGTWSASSRGPTS